MPGKVVVHDFDADGLALLGRFLQSGNSTLNLWNWVGPFVADLRPVTMSEVDNDRLIAWATIDTKKVVAKPPPWPGTGITDCGKEAKWIGLPAAFQFMPDRRHFTRVFFDDDTQEPAWYYCDIGEIAGFSVVEHGNGKVELDLHLVDHKLDIVQFCDSLKSPITKDLFTLPDRKHDDSLLRGFRTPVGLYKGELIPAVDGHLHDVILAEYGRLHDAACNHESPFDWAKGLIMPSDLPKLSLPKDYEALWRVAPVREKIMERRASRRPERVHLSSRAKHHMRLAQQGLGDEAARRGFHSAVATPLDLANALNDAESWPLLIDKEQLVKDRRLQEVQNTLRQMRGSRVVR